MMQFIGNTSNRILVKFISDEEHRLERRRAVSEMLEIKTISVITSSPIFPLRLTNFSSMFLILSLTAILQIHSVQPLIEKLFESKFSFVKVDILYT